MAIERNVGGTDRVLRAVGGAFLGLVAIGALTTDRGVLSVLAGLGAIGLLFNAATCFCGVNAALGIDTTED